jgi:hypothetical protein
MPRWMNMEGNGPLNLNAIRIRHLAREFLIVGEVHVAVHVISGHCGEMGRWFTPCKLG